MSHSDISINLGCILLAAGGSSRLGEPKQLVEINGEALVARAARNLLGLGAGKVVVVTGNEHSKVLNKLDMYPVSVIRNSNWIHGMGSSLALGVNELSTDFSGTLILLCDQWKVNQSDLNDLVQNWQSDISRIWASKWSKPEKGAFGPPIIFPGDLFSELKRLKGEQGARPVVKKYLDRVSFVEMQNAAYDLDTPEDLALILNRFP